MAVHHINFHAVHPVAMKIDIYTYISTDNIFALSTFLRPAIEGAGAHKLLYRSTIEKIISTAKQDNLWFLMLSILNNNERNFILAQQQWCDVWLLVAEQMPKVFRETNYYETVRGIWPKMISMGHVAASVWTQAVVQMPKAFGATSLWNCGRELASCGHTNFEGIWSHRSLWGGYK